MPRTRTALVLAIALLAGCSRHAGDSAAPVRVTPSPALLATSPAPRTPSALYDSDIWAQFDRPLDPATVTPLTVFLKLDGQRQPITVTYEAITQRVFLKPQVTLLLQRTYTAEFSPSVHGADGTPIPANVFFQFTTNSLRRPVYDYPKDDALEGGVATLGWGGAQGPANNLFFDVYCSPDSVAVARRSIPPLQHTVFTRYLTSARWPDGARMFWAVTAENELTHERLDGELHSFRTFDASVPVDSVLLRAADFGGNQVSRPTTQWCNSDSMPLNTDFNMAIHWNYTGLDTNVRVESAVIRMRLTNAKKNTIPTSQPTAWLAQNDWSPCVMRAPGPPFNESSGLLATAAAIDSLRFEIRSDRLASFVEAQIRRRTLLFGTLFHGAGATAIVSPSASDQTLAPRILLRFRRVTPSVAR